VTAIKAPVWLTEVLVVLFLEVGPDHFSSVNRNEAYFNLRVRVAGFRIAGLLYKAVLAFGIVNREHGHLRIIEPHECEPLAVRGPPKRFIPGCTAQYFFKVYP